MSDQDRNRQREHWQAIAEQLGLSQESEPTFESTTEAAKESSAEKPAPKLHPEPAEPTQVVEERGLSRGAEDPEYTADRVEEERLASSPPPAAEAAEPSSPTSQPEADMLSRRRGRGRRKAEASPAPGAEDKEAGAGERTRREETGRGKRQGGSPRRGRGKGRDKHENHPSDDAVTHTGGEDEESAQPEESDEDLSSDAYTWNVPSWNELIASLYRPER